MPAPDDRTAGAVHLPPIDHLESLAKSLAELATELAQDESGEVPAVDSNPEQ